MLPTSIISKWSCNPIPLFSPWIGLHSPFNLMDLPYLGKWLSLATLCIIPCLMVDPSFHGHPPLVPLVSFDTHSFELSVLG